MHRIFVSNVGCQYRTLLFKQTCFKFWESIVHLIVVSNFECQYRTLFLNQTSGVNTDSATAAASLYFDWHIETLSQHYIIIVDNDLPDYLRSFFKHNSRAIWTLDLHLKFPRDSQSAFAVFYVLALLALCSYVGQWYGIVALKLSTSRVGGDRVSEKNPPHSAGSGGVYRLPPRIMAKTFLSRNLAFLLAARWPPTLAPDCRHRLLFCLLFFDRFLEGIFSIFTHFGASLGTPKIIKNRKKSTSEAFLFPSLCISYFFTCFWLILGDFDDAKCAYFIGKDDKICILAKN